MVVLVLMQVLMLVLVVGDSMEAAFRKCCLHAVLRGCGELFVNCLRVCSLHFADCCSCLCVLALREHKADRMSRQSRASASGSLASRYNVYWCHIAAYATVGGNKRLGYAPAKLPPPDVQIATGVPAGLKHAAFAGCEPSVHKSSRARHLLIAQPAVSVYSLRTVWLSCHDCPSCTV